MTELTEQERAHVAIQVDHFIEILARRYGLNPNDVVDTVNWVRERKALANRLKMSGAVSVIGVVVAALFMALWEGLKALIQTRGHP